MAEEKKQVIHEPEEVQGVKVDLRKTLMLSPKMFAEKILKSEAVTCSLTLPMQFHTREKTMSVTTTVPFYMSSDISLGSLSNNWGEMVPFDGLGSFTDLMNFFNTVTDGSQVTMQSEAMSSKVWKGSKFDGFSVDCLFVATRRCMNPTKIIRLLAATALPDKLRTGDMTTTQFVTWVKEKLQQAIGWTGGIIKTAADSFEDGEHYNKESFKQGVDDCVKQLDLFISDVGMVAPLYYGTKLDSEEGRAVAPLKNTTLTLQIGNWFRADELLVDSISNISFSKEIIAPRNAETNTNRAGDLYQYQWEDFGTDYNFPLWGKCTLKLIPFSMMHKTKYEGYFIDNAPNFSNDHALDSVKATMFTNLGGQGAVTNYPDSDFSKLNLKSK